MEVTDYAPYIALMLSTGVFVYHTVDSIKLVFTAYVYKKTKSNKDPVWYQSLWRAVALVLGIGAGWFAARSGHFESPFAEVAGGLGAIFSAVIYNKVKLAVEGLKIRAGTDDLS